jgi:hypothetical protein
MVNYNVIIDVRRLLIGCGIEILFLEEDNSKLGYAAGTGVGDFKKQM